MFITAESESKRNDFSHTKEASIKSTQQGVPGDAPMRCRRARTRLAVTYMLRFFSLILFGLLAHVTTAIASSCIKPKNPTPALLAQNRQVAEAIILARITEIESTKTDQGVTNTLRFSVEEVLKGRPAPLPLSATVRRYPPYIEFREGELRLLAIIADTIPICVNQLWGISQEDVVLEIRKIASER